MSLISRPALTDTGLLSGWPGLGQDHIMANNEEVNQADIDDILNSPSKPPSNNDEGGSKPVSPSTPAKHGYDDISPQNDILPGSIQELEPDLEQFEEKRPSTTLEVGPDGLAAMS